MGKWMNIWPLSDPSGNPIHPYSIPLVFPQPFWRRRNCSSDHSLVGGWPTPLKNMSSSVGMILPNIWKHTKCIKMPQTTSQIRVEPTLTAQPRSTLSPLQRVRPWTGYEALAHNLNGAFRCWELDGLLKGWPSEANVAFGLSFIHEKWWFSIVMFVWGKFWAEQTLSGHFCLTVGGIADDPLIFGTPSLKLLYHPLIDHRAGKTNSNPGVCQDFYGVYALKSEFS